MSTEILPAGVPAEPAIETAEAPRKKRRGRLIALIVIGALVVLGVIAFLVAENLAKAYARDYVRTQIIEVLQLPEDADVAVALGGGSIILQALAGRVDSVDVEVPAVSFGELTGALTLHGEGVPLDAGAPVDALAIDFAIGGDDLTALGDDSATAFALDGDEVTLSTEFELFGSIIPLGLSLEPSAAEGALVLTPTSLTIGTQTFDAGSDDDSFLGQIAAALLQPQTLCIAGSVPQALVLADAQIDDAQLVLTFDGDGAALGGPEFSTPGTCAEG